MLSSAQKGTPRKYRRSATSDSSCRLCSSVEDRSHSKNLFKSNNRELLTLARSLSGEQLLQHENLPELICRACERRLGNFKSFRVKIQESQKKFAQSSKRLVPLSPSVNPALKVARREPNSLSDTVSVRTRLSFNTRSEEATSSNVDEQNEVFLRACSQMNTELVEVARRENNSVLRDRDFNGLASLSFSDIETEIETSCPSFYQFLHTAIEYEHDTEKKQAAFVLVYSIIMFKRCHELSKLQRVNSVLLMESGATLQVFERLSKYGFCLSKTSKYNILDDIGDHFMDLAVKKVQEGDTFVYVLDNIDWMEKVHDMRSDAQNKSVHAVATSLVFDRITSKDLPDDGPKKDLKDCDMIELVSLTDEETSITKERYKLLVAKILCQYFPAFKFLQDLVPAHLPHENSEAMGRKSTVVPFPVLMKDEKKYSEVVDVLDQLETWSHDIFSKAGISLVPDSSHEPPQLQSTTSRPDQPASHNRPVASTIDPLQNVKIPCYGDQLSRVRFAGAKDLRSGSHTARDRFDHIYPFRIVDWHCKKSFLKLVFNRLYKDSARELGTLRSFREKLQRRNVTKDVKHYEDCEQLFLTIGLCYTIEALTEFFQMPSKEARPTRNMPPFHNIHVGDNRKQYFDGILNQFVSTFLFPEESTCSASEQDRIMNYSLSLLQYYFLLIDFKDAVKEGNGKQLSILHKQLLWHFKSVPGFNVYAIEMLISIIQSEVFLSEAESSQVMWARVVNWKGGDAKNIEIDLLQENRNKDLKSLIKSMGANKTTKAITRASRAVGGVRQIVENFDEKVALTRKSSAHTHRSDESDVVIILSDVGNLKPFAYSQGRKYKSFPKIEADNLKSLNADDFESWLSRHKNNLLISAPLQVDEEEDGLDEDANSDSSDD